MFTSISIKNFKCFSNETLFNLKKINLFTGYNGRGKSTVFQAFLLLAQSLYENKNLNKLVVNGMFCKLGLFEDLINNKTVSGEIRFHFTTNDDKSNDLELAYQELSDRKGKLVDIIVDTKKYVEKTKQLGGTTQSKQASLQNYPEEIHSAFRNFYFVSADRIGPTAFEVKMDLSENNPIGNTGEYRLNVLAGHNDIQAQLAESICRIMEGGIMSVQGDSDAEKSSEVLRLYFSSTIGDSKPIKSINCGFGYSYIIPILLAAISMNGGCLFIENPEAHLHPYAQSQLIKELVHLCSKNQIQLFIETHSEHVINALRLCSLLEEYQDLTHESISMFFFDKDMSIKTLILNPNGQISPWPIGFFDQAERDAARIIQLGLLK